MIRTEYDETTAIPMTLPRQERRFRPRTVLIPLLFLALHYIVINIAATLYVLVYAFIAGSSQSGGILAILQDPDLLNSIITEQYPIITVIYALALIPIYLIYLMLNRRRDGRSLLLERARMIDILPALAMMIGALGVTNIWFNLLTSLQDSVPFIDEQVQSYMETANAFSSSSGYLWLILGISIMAPICEELVFRGIIQGELRKAMPEWAAIIIQALIFALFHMQLLQISYVILPGLLLGLAYYWSRSILVPIFMHITFNFLGSALPAMIGEDEILNNILFYSEIAFILVGLLAAVFFWMNRRKKAAAQLSGT